MKSKLKISDGWIWSALIAISFLVMLFAKLFTGWEISWWVVTLPLWIMPALVICIIGLCIAGLMGLGFLTIVASAVWWTFGGDSDCDDDYDDYDD